MSRQREAANLGGAAIEDVEEHALAGLDADGVAEPSIRPLMVKEPYPTSKPWGMPLASEAFMAASPAPLSSGTVAEGDRKSMAISPPRLKEGSNSFKVRNTSWSYWPGLFLGSI